MVCRKAATSGLCTSSQRKGEEEVCASLWWIRGLHLLQALHQPQPAESPAGLDPSGRCGLFPCRGGGLALAPCWSPSPFLETHCVIIASCHFSPLPPGTRRGLWSEPARPVFPGPICSLGMPSLGYSNAWWGWMGAFWWGEHVNYPCCGNSHKPSMRPSPRLSLSLPLLGSLGERACLTCREPRLR